MGWSGLSAAVTNNARTHEPTTTDGGRNLAMRLYRTMLDTRCSIPDCPQRATAMLFYLDDQERFYCQTDACDGHMNQLCAGLRVIERGPPLTSKSVA